MLSLKKIVLFFILSCTNLAGSIDIKIAEVQEFNKNFYRTEEEIDDNGGCHPTGSGC